LKQTEREREIEMIKKRESGDKQRGRREKR
jgi:hypothetical protein